MSVITGKIRKGKMQRLTFVGNTMELHKVLTITQERITSQQITFPPDYVLVNEIRKTLGGVTLTPDVEAWYNDQLDVEARVSMALRDSDAINMSVPLRDYQRSGIAFGKTAVRFILGDERGLGKTLESYGIVAELQSVLILVPAYGIEHWSSEYQLVNKGHTIFTVCGNVKQKAAIVEEALRFTGKKIVIVSCGTFIKPTCYSLVTTQWDAVIMDESHRISNHKNVLTKVVQTVSKNTQYLIFITGSALSTRFADCMWSMLNCIDPLRFSSYWAFFHKFVESYVDFYGRIPLHAKNMDVLAEILAPLYLRRTKAEVALELPPKIEQVIKVKLKPEHQAIYDRIVKEKLVNDIVLIQGIQLFGYLQRLVNFPEGLGYEHYDAKTEVVLELVQDMLYNGEKVVIFGWHKDYLRQLHAGISKISIDRASEGKRLTNYQAVYVDGDLSPTLRNAVIHRFKTEDEIGVLIGTIKSMGELINIEEATNVIVVEGFWNPEVVKNAIDRCHRLTSKLPVNVYWILAENTIDEYVYDVCAEKEVFIDETHTLLKMIQKMKGVNKNEGSN